MKLARIAISIFFCIALVLFSFTAVKDKLFTDHTAPVINDSQGYLEVSIAATDEDLLTGLTAEDNKDGDVTSTIVVTGKSEFIAKGQFKVTYAAFDQSNNVGSYTRSVSYTDYTSPRFTVTQPFIYADSGNYDLTENVTVNDCIDGDISGRIKAVITDYSNYTCEPGMLTVSNSSGEEIKMNFVVQYLETDLYNAARPALDSYIFYTEAGRNVDLRSHITGLWYSGSSRTFEETSYSYTADDMSIDMSNVDLNVPGSYVASVTLNSEDESVQTGTTYVTIMVED